jgi:hypothetical protein
VSESKQSPIFALALENYVHIRRSTQNEHSSLLKQLGGQEVLKILLQNTDNNLLNQELIKDYDCVINYHPRKANVVADALGRKSRGGVACLKTLPRELHENLQRFDLEFVQGEVLALMAKLEIRPTLL